MGLLNKINKYINFSAKRNFAEEKSTEEQVAKIGEEVRTPVDAPKIPAKDMNENVIKRQEEQIAKLSAQEAEAKDETKESEEVKTEEAPAQETKVAETEVKTETETPEPSESGENTGGEEAAVAAAEAKEKADEANKAEEVAETTEKSENDDEYAKVAGIDAKESEEESKEETSDKESDEAKKELKEESEVPEVKDYDGAKVADANGKTHTIVKRADGYYIKGTTSKVLDAEGNPTSKYRTLGNALKNGQSVNDYVKSKGGWAKYNKELKSESRKS